jgi:hypothetical protein
MPDFLGLNEIPPMLQGQQPCNGFFIENGKTLLLVWCPSLGHPYYDPLGTLAKHVSFAGFGIDGMIRRVLVATGSPAVITAVNLKVEVFLIIFVPKI